MKHQRKTVKLSKEASEKLKEYALATKLNQKKEAIDDILTKYVPTVFCPSTGNHTTRSVSMRLFVKSVKAATINNVSFKTYIEAAINHAWRVKCEGQLKFTSEVASDFVSPLHPDLAADLKQAIDVILEGAQMMIDIQKRDYR
jgi:hypothetical protein